MFDKFKEEIRQNPKKFIIALVVLFAGVLVVIISMREYLTGIWPNSSRIAQERKALLASQKDLQQKLNEEYELKERRRSFVENSHNFWLTARDGEAALNIQKKINHTAEETGIVLSSVGAARSEKVTEGITLVSISIRSKAPLKKISEFFNELTKLKPRAYWKSVVIRPDNPRNPVEVVLSGNIQFILITHQEALKLFQEKK